MKAKHPGRITAARENVPVIILVGIAFGASYGHILTLCGEHGPHGWVQYATAGVVDLLFAIGAEERQRDRRIGRQRTEKWVSLPMVVMITGVALTLTANLATAQPGLWGYFVAALAAGALLLALSILERRTSYKAAPVAASNAEPVPAVTPEPEQPVMPPVTAPAIKQAAPVTQPRVTPAAVADAGEGPYRRTDGEWLGEIRKLYANQGDELSVRKLMPQLKLIGGGKGIAIDRASEMLRTGQGGSQGRRGGRWRCRGGGLDDLLAAADGRWFSGSPARHR